MITDVEHLFMCLLAICISSSEKWIFRAFAHFLIRCFFFDVDLYEFLLYLYINPLLDMLFANILSYSIGCLFILLMVFSAVQKLFSFMPFHFFIFASVAFAFGVKSKNSLPRPMSRRLSPTFSSRIFMVSGLTFKSLIHFELIFVYGVRWGRSHCFSCGYPVFPPPFIEETILSLNGDTFNGSKWSLRSPHIDGCNWTFFIV